MFVLENFEVNKCTHHPENWKYFFECVDLEAWFVKNEQIEKKKQKGAQKLFFSQQ